MIHWSLLEEHLKTHYFYKINNNKNKTIVLFGNCHLLPITYYLNAKLLYSYNIIVVISWFYERTFTSDELVSVNKQIEDIVRSCDIFIYQKHNNSFGIHANNIISFVNSKCILLNVPNFLLDYLSTKSTSSDIEILKKDFIASLFRLSTSITESDFTEFEFIVANIYQVQFFNTIYHPTHYLLYLLSTSIYNKIMNIPEKITIHDYYDKKTREEFLSIELKDFIYLPGKSELSPINHDITGIHYGADYFDITF